MHATKVIKFCFVGDCSGSLLWSSSCWLLLLVCLSLSKFSPPVGRAQVGSLPDYSNLCMAINKVS